MKIRNTKILLFLKSFKKMNAEKLFEKSLSKLGNIVYKLDNKLGLHSDFGFKYSTKPDLSHPENYKQEEKKETAQVEVNNQEKPNTESTNKKEKKEKKETKEKKTENAEEKIDNTNKEVKDVKEAKEKPKKKEVDPNAKLHDSFKDVDFRVAKVVKIINMEGSENLFHCWVDVGEENLREIGCGLRKYGVSAEEFTKLPIVVFANLKPKKLNNIMSNGMILCCENANKKEEFELVRPPLNSTPGEPVFLEGGKPKEQRADFISGNKFGKAIPLLKTDDNCVATFGGIKMFTSQGEVTVHSFKNSPIS